MDIRTGKQLKITLLSLWGRYNISVVTVILLACSVFYFAGARRMQSYVSADNPHLFATEDQVTILEVIDGDELLIGKDDGSTTKFRVLGIKSFSATLSDPLLSEYGKICFDYLRASAMGKKAKLVTADKRIDNEGRLLGTLFLKGTGDEFTVDLGLELVRKGYTLVYTRFAFKDMQAYLTVQNEARKNKAGFWSNERISARASSMLLLWDEQRRKEKGND